jgi:Na+/H+ antiporter NhaD/arsenite permease-like protein
VVIKWATLGIFVACYGLILWRKVKISYVSVASAVILVAIGALAPKTAFFKAIDWNVIAIYWGFLMVSVVFAESGVPARLANYLVRRSKTEGRALLAVCVLAAILSAFMENVGVTLMMVPIGFAMAKAAGSSPTKYLIAIACSSNIVTTVTMIADPPALILARQTGMTFFDFYWFQGKVGLGLISIAAVAAGFVVLYLTTLRKMNNEVHVEAEEVEIQALPAILFVGGIAALGVSPYIHVPIGYIGLAVGFLALVLARKKATKVLAEFDWHSLAYIIGIFVVVGAVNNVGLLKDLANGIVKLGVNSPTLALIFLTWLSVALSSFVDNVPFTMLMIPVCLHMGNAIGMANPFPLLFGMLVGTGLGGNLTPVGATANVFACGALEKAGHKVRLWEFMKIGALFSITAVAVAHVLLQLLWV